MIDKEKADKVVKFIRNLKHTKGEWAGKRFNLMPWQEKIVRDLFGTVNEDGTRQYREAYISVARKNGKTELCGAIAAYCLFADGEKGGEIYTAAGDHDQASLVFNASKTMVEQSPVLYKNAKILDSVKRIVFAKKNSFYRAISAEAYTKHGYNPSCVINDELHVWPNRDLYDVLKTGTGARKQPLIINITTSGFDRSSLCYELYDYAKKVQSGVIEDPTFYTAIFELDEGDDWKDEQNWYKANPGLGVYRELKEMQDYFKRACEIIASENTFKRLYLNQWTSQETRWVSLSDWDVCGVPLLTETFTKRQAYGGLDLSATTDITAFVLVFAPYNGDGTIDILPFFWMPEEDLKKKIDRDHLPYDVWIKKGLIQGIPGKTVDYDIVRAKILELRKQYGFTEISYDPWNATQMALDLEKEGLVMVSFKPTFQFFSPPMKEFLAKITTGKIRHGGNPVLRAMLDNMRVVTDLNENVRPDKSKSNSRIDGIVASIMAYDRLMRHPELEKFVYQSGSLSAFSREEMKPETAKQEIKPASRRVGIECIRCHHDTESFEACQNCGKRIEFEVRNVA